jgi:hypothetical protein
MKRLGLTNIQITINRYGHPLPSQNLEHAEALGELIEAGAREFEQRQTDNVVALAG